MFVIQPGKTPPEKPKNMPPAIRMANCMQPVAPPPNSGGVIAMMPTMKNCAIAYSAPSAQKKNCNQFRALAVGTPGLTRSDSIWTELMRAPSKKAQHKVRPAIVLHQSAIRTHDLGGPFFSAAGVSK